MSKVGVVLLMLLSILLVGCGKTVDIPTPVPSQPTVVHVYPCEQGMGNRE